MLIRHGPHRDSDDIWVRYNDKTEYLKSGDWSKFNFEHEPIWYPAYYALPAVRQLVFDLARHVEAERIGGIFIWRVKPGQQIHPHKDWGWHVDYYDKFNICVNSAPMVFSTPASTACRRGTGAVWPPTPMKARRT